MMETVQKIQQVSLVSSIFEELEKQLGFGDKSKAELIINLAEQNSTIEQFQTALVEHGFDFSDQFSKNLLHLINHLKTILTPEVPPLAPQKSFKEHQESLPIFRFKEDLLKAVQENQILIVFGEVGSGKTTQLTQYLEEAGYTSFGKIACTQPRCISAMSSANRVAEEYGCRLGEEVGYSIRLEDCTSNQTKIKYVTDSVLLREFLVDPDLKQYSVVILDEAQERTSNTDILFGLMKRVCTKRTDLKLIITSTTTGAAEKFSKYFDSSPMFAIPGKAFPITILYTKEPEEDPLEASMITVLQIHLTRPPGDILVFLADQHEVDTASQSLAQRAKALGENVPELTLLPIHSLLPLEMQPDIFKPAPNGSRKVVLAASASESSVLIDGISYVVDSGFIKHKVYNTQTQKDELLVAPVSKATAIQRASRSGRKGPGECYRLYTFSAYQNELVESPVFEIQRVNLTHAVLILKAVGVNDFLDFDFIDAPNATNLLSALHTLFELGALDDEGLLTELGRKMALEKK